jgi:hypothetical protein
MSGRLRVFKLKLVEERVPRVELKLGHSVIVGELWQGKGRVPVAGVLTYRGRVDAVITFFVDQFLHDDIFQPGDSLVLASAERDSGVVLARRTDSAGL